MLVEEVEAVDGGAERGSGVDPIGHCIGQGFGQRLNEAVGDDKVLEMGVVKGEIVEAVIPGIGTEPRGSHVGFVSGAITAVLREGMQWTSHAVDARLSEVPR